MSAVNELITHEQGKRHRSGWTDPNGLVKTKMRPTDIASGFGVLNEYKTSLELWVVTRCNDVEWAHDQREIARKRLLKAIYGEVQMYLHQALVAVRGGDPDEVERIIKIALEATGEDK